MLLNSGQFPSTSGNTGTTGNASDNNDSGGGGDGAFGTGLLATTLVSLIGLRRRSAR